MNCRNCGTIISDAETFCASCGTPKDPAASMQQTTHAPVQPVPQPMQQPQPGMQPMQPVQPMMQQPMQPGMPQPMAQPMQQGMPQPQQGMQPMQPAQPMMQQPMQQGMPQQMVQPGQPMMPGQPPMHGMPGMHQQMPPQMGVPKKNNKMTIIAIIIAVIIIGATMYFTFGGNSGGKKNNNTNTNTGEKTNTNKPNDEKETISCTADSEATIALLGFEPDDVAEIGLVSSAAKMNIILEKDNVDSMNMSLELNVEEEEFAQLFKEAIEENKSDFEDDVNKVDSVTLDGTKITINFIAVLSEGEKQNRLSVLYDAEMLGFVCEE